MNELESRMEELKALSQVGEEILQYKDRIGNIVVAFDLIPDGNGDSKTLYRYYGNPNAALGLCMVAQDYILGGGSSDD